MMNKQEDIISRLNGKFIKNYETGCWNWTGATTPPPRQYGQLYVNGKTILAHRISYVVHVGKIPQGMQVLHKCDNPRCINPDHLFLGTQKDNIQDCVRKGRLKIPGFHGSKHPNSKLTEAQVVEIYKKKGIETLPRIAESFNVTRQAIYLIHIGANWGWLTRTLD
jgi:hypothetical protein